MYGFYSGNMRTALLCDTGWVGKMDVILIILHLYNYNNPQYVKINL